RCPNCGSRTPPPQDSPSSAGELAGPAPAGSPTATEPDSDPVGRATASVVALVAGLMFFVPLVAQAIGIVAGAYALTRPRDSGARKGLAAVGLALSLAALVGWVLVFGTNFGVFSGSSATVRVPSKPISAAVGFTKMEEAESLDPSVWRDVTGKVQQATVAYRRDYGRWPASVEEMRGQSLSLTFALPDTIRYRPVPARHADNPNWILLVSEPTLWDFDGAALARSHRLIQQINGTSALLASEVVAQRLDRDDTGDTIPSRKKESTEDDEP
ncbi:MAG: DUF4190 domain-containing protein, partial [Phycisphaerae bacterium]